MLEGEQTEWQWRDFQFSFGYSSFEVFMGHSAGDVVPDTSSRVWSSTPDKTC